MELIFMKKCLTYFLLLCLTFSSFAACGANGGNSMDNTRVSGSDHESETSSLQENNAHTHTWKESKHIAPACSTTGEDTYICECGEEKTEIIPMLGHTLENGACIICQKRVSNGLEYKLSKDKTYYEIVGIGNCQDSDVIIPAVYDNLPVKVVGSKAFEDCEIITSVTMDNGIEQIDPYAFHDCENLIHIQFPESLSSIAYSVVNNCDSLVEIKIPKNVKSIGSYTFDNCDKLEKITVDEGNEKYVSIDGVLYWIKYDYEWVDGAYQGIPSDYLGLQLYPSAKQEEVFELPVRATSIAEFGFGGAVNLKQIKLHENLTHIGEDAFISCISLEEIDIPDQVKRIDGNDFHGCKNLRVVKFGQSVELTEDTWHDFNGCVSLERFEVDENNAFYSTIDGNLYSKDGTVLFRYCSGKKETNFKIPDGVVAIEESAFLSSNNLEKIEIPKGVQKIEHYAFAYCDNLNVISYLGTIEEWNSIEISYDLGGYNRNPVDEIICENGKVAL